MNKKYLIAFVCSVIVIIITSVGIVKFSDSKKNNINEKLEQEMSYVETKLIGMINSLNDITFSNSVLLEQNTIKAQSNSEESESSDKENSKEGNSQENTKNDESQNGKETDYSRFNVENNNILLQTNNNVDWSYLKNTVETLYSSWPTIMMDLHSHNIKNENILDFSNTLDTSIVNIEKEDKKETLRSLAKLYSLIPVFFEQFTDDTDKININYTKSSIINCYTLLEDEDWERMKQEIANASNYFGIIINHPNEDRQQSNISKVYIGINEMNNAINLKDKKLFYLKYINLMESAMQI